MVPAVRRRWHKHNLCGKAIKPTSASTSYMVQWVEAFILSNRGVIVAHMVQELRISGPSPTWLSQIVFTMCSLFFDFRTQRRNVCGFIGISSTLFCWRQLFLKPNHYKLSDITSTQKRSKHRWREGTHHPPWEQNLKFLHKRVKSCLLFFYFIKLSTPSLCGIAHSLMLSCTAKQ